MEYIKMSLFFLNILTATGSTTEIFDLGLTGHTNIPYGRIDSSVKVSAEYTLKKKYFFLFFASAI